ncbi:uncharacterized protein Z520_03300 [Fonsecaea multimorphosa CBS 102226]|uniref:Uncharacterized protein n=1 Tax=Fonsecaea multimorphosa CBS 102226 TaxID=1442371 RepID=A0A0D2IUB6_9EURO|nr:uncharacterized protein Z520_03300 [Fonsecaea multimorphosa CBS 102226]KIY00637.1 hypothetical protein Z520_03300 [Fonsecaea multimorphosa CBS 102226]
MAGSKDPSHEEKQVGYCEDIAEKSHATAIKNTISSRPKKPLKKVKAYFSPSTPKMGRTRQA